MDHATIWLIIIAVGIGTFALRLSFIQLAGRFALPARAARALRFIPAAVLSAIILPAALQGAEGEIDMALDNPRLIASIVAALIAWQTRSVSATLVAGMATLWLLQSLM